MLDKIREFPDEIVFHEGGPCITLYQLIHRHSPENNQDVVFFNNTIRDLEGLLTKEYKDSDIDKIMKPFQALRDDKDFWTSSIEGIAILANEEKFLLYMLPEGVENKLVVGEAFHILPLLRTFQFSDMYNLLGLQGNDFKLYEGSKYELAEIKLEEGVPRTIEEVLGSEHTERYLNHGTYSGSAGSATFHGQGSKKDELEEDLKRYFRYVDKLVNDNYSKTGKLPLILAGLSENQGLFRKLSNNTYLMDAGINSSYKEVGSDVLIKKAWEIMEAVYQERISKLTENFNQAKANDLGSDDLHKIKKAILDKRIKTMMIEENRNISPELDGLVKLVLKEKGQIVVLTKEQMPSETGVAAIYRF